MKKMTQLAAAIALATGAITATPVMAEVSANIGYASEYYFRGIYQAESSPSAGIDYEANGFYAGAWTADVGDGLEVDIYGGWGFETESGFSASLGFTSYQYTGEFDTEYNELNLSLAYSFLSLDYADGTREDDESLGVMEESDYSHTSVTAEHNGFYASYSWWGKDWDGEYTTVGYGTEIGGFDAGVAFIFTGEETGDSLNGFAVADDDEAIIFTLGKSFDL